MLSGCVLSACLLHVLAIKAVASVGISVQVPQHVEVGTAVTLECIIPSEIKANGLFLDWKKDSTTNSVYQYRFVDDTRVVFDAFKDKVSDTFADATSLHFNNVSIDDDGQYICELQDINGDKYEDKRKMNVIKKPVITMTTSRQANENLAAGESLQVNCTAEGSFPETQIQWLLNEKEFNGVGGEPKTHTLADGSMTTVVTGELIIEDEHLGKELACKATIKDFGHIGTRKFTLTGTPSTEPAPNPEVEVMDQSEKENNDASIRATSATLVLLIASLVALLWSL